MWQLFLLVTCQIAIFHTHLILNVSVCHQPRDEVFLSPAFKLNTLFKNPWGWALKCILTALKTGCYYEPMKSWDTWFLQETATLWWSERTWCIALNQTIQIQRLKMCSTSNIHRSKMQQTHEGCSNLNPETPTVKHWKGAIFCIMSTFD